MEKFTAFVFTNTSVAEIRALKDMAIGTLGSSLAVAIEAEIPADWIGLRTFSMNVGARVIMTFAIGKMEAEGRSLLSSLMRKVTSIAIGAVVLEKPVPTNSDLRGIVDEAAIGAFDT